MTSYTIGAILAALIQVESGGRADAIGDGGRAIGCLQIHAAAVADVNRIYGTRFAHADARCPVKARRIAALYLAHYCPPARAAAPASMSDAEIIARVWNGGPRGWRKPATRTYWRKVQRQLGEAR